MNNSYINRPLTLGYRQLTRSVWLILAFAFFSVDLMAQVVNARESDFPAEGSISESDWGTYLLGINDVNRNVRLGVVNDSHTRAEIQLVNNNTPHGRIFFKTINTNGSAALTRMTIESNGNVGIGTTTPQAKLAVEGNILAKEVKVKTDITVPDYVFEPDYKLPTLADVEAYVKEHKHLPEIPSADDIAQHGLDLAEMNLLLLKKVEELTLHLIEKEKETKMMQLQLRQHEQRLNQIQENE